MGINLRIGNIQNQLIRDYGDEIRKIFAEVRGGTALGCDMTG